MPSEQKLAGAADNEVYVGKKPTMIYVIAVQTQARYQNEIRVLARGRTISSAVDVVLIALDRFLKGWVQKSIEVRTEVIPKDNGKIERVSVIEFVLSKQ